jgi:hypothetical protein
MKKALFIAMVFLMAGCAGKTNKNDQQVVESVAEAPAILVDKDGVSYVEALPKGFNEDDLFGLILVYGDYVMEASAYPLHNNNWIITSHWCLEEDEGVVYEEDGEGNEVSYPYEDPFEGYDFPVVQSSENSLPLSFSTRNYGGETINFYAAPDSKEVSCFTNYKEITLRVIDADPKTRRLLVCSSPEDWCWGEPEGEWDAEYRHPFVDLRGWVDEEWVCANTLSTCP